jgi:hypothetical protein
MWKEGLDSVQVLYYIDTVMDVQKTRSPFPVRPTGIPGDHAKPLALFAKPVGVGRKVRPPHITYGAAGRLANLVLLGGGTSFAGK